MALVLAMRLEICPDDAARLLGFAVRGKTHVNVSGRCRCRTCGLYRVNVDTERNARVSKSHS
jgi:hypothetical protein